MIYNDLLLILMLLILLILVFLDNKNEYKFLLVFINVLLFLFLFIFINNNWLKYKTFLFDNIINNKNQNNIYYNQDINTIIINNYLK